LLFRSGLTVDYFARCPSSAIGYRLFAKPPGCLVLSKAFRFAPQIVDGLEHYQIAVWLWLDGRLFRPLSIIGYWLSAIPEATWLSRFEQSVSIRSANSRWPIDYQIAVWLWPDGSIICPLSISAIGYRPARNAVA
jgi:hypothetical protein